MRYLWITVMLLAASPACAQWVRHYEDTEAVFYFDPTTIERHANFVRVWTLEDLKQRGEIGEMSRRWFNEFNCERATARVLSLSAHLGQMVSGKTLTSYHKPSEWRRIQPGRPFATLLPFLCATPAHWTRAVETDSTVEYVDLETIEKRGGHRRVWTLQDLKQRGGQGELSFRRLLEFDCQKRQYLIVWIAGHSGPMAGGRVLGSGENPIPNWYGISKGSAVEASLKMVCAAD